MSFRNLFADDIFISYSHVDGGTYAVGLANELLKCGFSCFVDKLGTDPSTNLPVLIRRKIRDSAMLVIIGTEHAGTSQAIEDEIKEFLNSPRPSLIVPVDFEKAIYRARWYDLIRGVPFETETSLTALEDGNPSLSVISCIEKQFSYKRRNQRLRLITIATLCLVTLLIAVAIRAATFAGQKIRQANKAEEQRIQAVSAAEAASRKEAAALESKQTFEALAQKAALEAQKQTTLANLAVQQTEKANQAAREANAATEHQQAVSDSLQLANQSRRTLARSYYSIAPSVSLGIQALKRFPTVEADAALRQSLSLLPHRERTEQYAGDFLDVDLSPDGRHLATLSWKNIIRVFRLGNQTPIKEFVCHHRKPYKFDYRSRLITLSNDAAFAAVISGNEAIVLDLNAGLSHTITLVEAGFSPGQITISPDGKYIALVYGRANPPLSGVRVLEATSGRPVVSFSDDLDINPDMISFGPNGDLVVAGRLLNSSEINSGPKFVQNAWAMIAWPLSKLAEQKTGRTLMVKNIGRGIEKRIPIPRGGDPVKASEAIAIGPSNSLIAFGDVVYQLSGEGEYVPIAYLPYTNSSIEARFSERRYAFNSQGTQVIVISAKGFPTTNDWMSNWFPRADENTNEFMIRDSRSSWSAESWDLADYSLRVSQSKPIVYLKLSSDGRSVRVRQDRPLTIQCFKANNTYEMKLVPDKESETSKAMLSVSSNLDFFVTADNKTGSVVRACDPMGTSFPFDHDLTGLTTASITDDGKFLALVGSSGKMGEGIVTDVYHLDGNQYQRKKRLLISDRPQSIILSSNGRHLIVNTNQGFKLWDVDHTREILIPGLEQGGIESMRFSPDAEFLVVFDIDGPRSASTRILRLDHLRQSKIFRYSWQPAWPPYITFSPSGRVFLDVGSGGVTRLVETKTGRVIHQLDSIVFAYHAAFSADEGYLAIATQDQEVLVYRTNDLREGPVARLQPNGIMGGLAISPDNRYVVTGNSVYRSYSSVVRDYVLRMWPLQSDDLINIATERLSVFQRSSQR